MIFAFKQSFGLSPSCFSRSIPGDVLLFAKVSIPSRSQYLRVSSPSNFSKQNSSPSTPLRTRAAGEASTQFAIPSRP